MTGVLWATASARTATPSGARPAAVCRCSISPSLHSREFLLSSGIGVWRVNTRGWPLTDCGGPWLVTPLPEPRQLSLRHLVQA